jgi:hypothetical protein
LIYGFAFALVLQKLLCLFLTEVKLHKPDGEL